MKCACIIMFVSVCKRVNQFFFFLNLIPPYTIESTGLHFTLFDFLLSFLEQLLVYYSSSRSYMALCFL